MEVQEGYETVGLLLPFWVIANNPHILTYYQECGCRPDFKKRPYRILLNGDKVTANPPREIRTDNIGEVVTSLCRCGAPLQLQDEE
ncbi:hypothetical protein C4544_01970 [candidate division WS5 bacterium]|uniref:Uncharacterized protein n=1 Tax=candidate division WS5 bacterium TaxID=2093353 RepID=A0A419DF35_9BACT|nr:MAG: hypothetical protein C4544_01970 [candidate division WS5 bacterium]